MLCGISPAFASGLFPIGGQIAHVLRTRAPCVILYCYGVRTRLACVLSTPPAFALSQDQTLVWKPEAWAKKMSPIYIGASHYPSKLLSLDSLRPI